MKLPTLRPGTRVVTRLRFTFLSIAMVVGVAVTIGSAQLHSLSQSQEQLLAHSIPSLVRTEELARELTALLGLTSQLDEQRSQEDLARLQLAIEEKNASLKITIAALPEADLVEPVRNEFADMQLRLEGVISKSILLRLEILQIGSALKKNVDGLKAIRSEFADTTEPLLIDAALAFEEDLENLGNQTSDRRSTFKTDVSLFNTLTELTFQINLSVDAAEQLALTTKAAETALATKRLQFELRSIAQLLLKLENDANRKKLASGARTLRALVFGPDGISQNLKDLRGARERFQTTKVEQRELTGAISEISNRFVTLAKRDIEETAISLDRSLLTTLVVLAATVIVTFMIVSMVSLFVVEKQINRRMARLTAAVRRIASGNTDHVVSVAGPDELGEMARALEIFKDNARELRRSNAELQKFAYVASHDLRSPLQAIRNLAEWTLEDAGDTLSPGGRSNLELMLQRVERLSTLLADLLEYAQAGRAESNVAEINIKETVAELAELVDPSGNFRLEITGNVKNIETYSTPLRQILLNLISNATKHHDRGQGQITVAVLKIGSRIQLAVSDDGPGISPAYHDRVFGLFETLKSRDEVEGSGLGLAIIRKLVEQHGGTITVASDPDKARGTTFRFDFPDLQDETQTRSAA